MTEQLTPPPELVEDWLEIAKPLLHRPPSPSVFADLAARWGYDQAIKELETFLDKAND